MSNKSITDVIVAQKASSASRYEGGGLFDYFKSKPLPQPIFDEKDKYTLSNRILTYRFIKSYLDYHLKPNDCLTEKKFGDKMGYTIRDIVDLVEQFKIMKTGIFLSVNKTYIYKTVLNTKTGREFLIASKVMEVSAENIQETAIMKKITEEIIEKELSKHFVIMYKSSLCDKTKTLVNYNELCDGDIKMLFENGKINDADILFNILFQSLISLATFHNIIGYAHLDAHSGNFLYQVNNEDTARYYHYKLGDTSFYLKSCVYNICLFDFGLSKPFSKDKIYIQDNNRYILRDCKRITTYFKNYFNKEGSLHDILKEMETYSDNNVSNPQFKTLFFEEILRLMKKHSPEGMILDVLPDGAVPLNEKPFIISNHKAIGGSRGIVVKYKSTGEHVHIVYNNRKLKRCVYAKTKGRGKYCKINKIYILLSKLKLTDE
jgi:hypothetical protein